MSEDKGYVYFARPIDFMDMTGDHIRFQTAIEQMLDEAGYSMYHPAYAWYVNGPMTPDLARAIESSNRFALRRAQAVVAWLPEGVQTQGVPMEIEFASRELGIPVIVFGKVGASIMGNPLVACLPDSELEHLGKHLDACVPDIRRRNNPTILYSTPANGRLEHAYPGDAGVDLRASEDRWIPAGGSAMIPTGVRMAIPRGMFGWVVARSSTWNNHRLMVMPGIIDESYQGELFVSVHNAGDVQAHIDTGCRVAQLLLLANMWPGFHLTRTDEENVFPLPSSRGSNGFGSSGK